MTAFFDEDFHRASQPEVNVRRLADRHAWANVFGVSPGELIAAIEAVGADADRILLHLRNKAKDFAARGNARHLTLSA